MTEELIHEAEIEETDEQAEEGEEEFEEGE